MNTEDIVREICLVIPITCPTCGIWIPGYRIDLKDMRKGVWYLWVLCGSCNKSCTILVDTHLPPNKAAIKQICGDRSLYEEVTLRNSGIIPPRYEQRLPSLLGKLWGNGPKENPYPPRTAV